MPKHSVNLKNKLLKSLVWKKENVVVSITNFNVGFVSLSPLHTMQVAKAPCCAQSCSVLSVPAKVRWVRVRVCVYVGEWEMKT